MMPGPSPWMEPHHHLQNVLKSEMGTWFDRPASDGLRPKSLCGQSEQFSTKTVPWAVLVCPVVPLMLPSSLSTPTCSGQAHEGPASINTETPLTRADLQRARWNKGLLGMHLLAGGRRGGPRPPRGLTFRAGATCSRPHTSSTTSEKLD